MSEDFNFRSVSITLDSTKSILDFPFQEDTIFESKLTNFTIYGEIGERNSIIINSEEIRFFDQINPEFSDKDIFKYEHFELKNLSYSLKLDYLIENCSKWEYFSNKSFEGQNDQ
jgi:hypothetical protein